MTVANPGTTLREEHQLIGALVELMKQEQQFLVDADGDGLATVTPHKAQLISQLATLASQRHQALAAAGCAAEEAGMETWLASAEDSEARAGWQQLLERTREAKELNRVNGLLINKQLSHNQTVLNAMRAPAGGTDTGVYGPSGQTNAGGPSRRFVIG